MKIFKIIVVLVLLYFTYKGVVAFKNFEIGTTNQVAKIEEAAGIEKKGEVIALAESLLSETEIKDSTKGYAFKTKRIIMKPNTYPKNWRTNSPTKEE